MPDLRLFPACLRFAAVGNADDFDPAGYHDAKCSRCHDTSVYTRENRRVKTLPALHTQVERCDANLGTQLFPDDLSLLVDHLNTNFYKFAN